MLNASLNKMFNLLIQSVQWCSSLVDIQSVLDLFLSAIIAVNKNVLSVSLDTLCYSNLVFKIVYIALPVK